MIFNKTQAYAIGWLWADGSSNKKHKYVVLEIVSDDFKYIVSSLETIGKLSISHRTPPNRRPQSCARIHNRELRNWLMERGFANKSRISPCEIIKDIGEDNLKAFISGFIDGDGCFYLNKESGCQQFSLSGSFEQDWSAFEKVFSNLGIKYSLQRRETNNGNYSCLRVTNREGLLKIVSFVYDEDCPCLPRKRDKANEIKKFIESKNPLGYRIPK